VRTPTPDVATDLTGIDIDLDLTDGTVDSDETVK